MLCAIPWICGAFMNRTVSPRSRPCTCPPLSADIAYSSGTFARQPQRLSPPPCRLHRPDPARSLPDGGEGQVQRCGEYVVVDHLGGRQAKEPGRRVLSCSDPPIRWSAARAVSGSSAIEADP